MSPPTSASTSASISASISAATPVSASSPAALSIAGLETVYDLLASQLDRVGPEKTELFLVKLALLNANALGSAEQFRSHLEAAAADL